MASPYSSAFYADLGLSEFDVVFTSEAKQTDQPEAEELRINGSRSTHTSMIASRSGSHLRDPTFSASFYVLQDYIRLKRVRDQLVKSYFHNVHPVCPIVDRRHFETLYEASPDLAFLGHFSHCVFYAMMFAAVQFMTEEEFLDDTQFECLQQAQSTYYGVAKNAYRALLLKPETGSMEAELAKTAILLSYWCPLETTADVNSYWTDRAIYHTRSAMAQLSSMSASGSHDLKVLYWTCVVRNTQVSFSLRRPSRLHEIDIELISPDDLFASFLALPSASESKKTRRDFEGFIWTCKISRILNSALTCIRQFTAFGNWNMVSKQSIDQSDPDDLFKRSIPGMRSLQFLTFQDFEIRLMNLWTEYCSRVSVANWKSGSETTHIDPSEGNYILFAMNEIMTLSGIVTIYGFYFDVPLEREDPCTRHMVLSKMESFSARVTSFVELVLRNVEVSRIPLSMLAWTLLPAAVSITQLRFQNLFDTQAKLMRLASILADRFKGAAAVQNTFRDLEALISRLADQEDMIAAQQDWLTGDPSAKNDAKNEAKIHAVRQALKLLDMEMTCRL